MPNFTLVGAGAWVRDPGNCGEFYKFWKYNLSLRRTCPLRHSYEIFKFYVRFLASFLCYFARGSGGENIVMSTSVCVSVCLSVCLSVREHISAITCTIFTNFSAHVTYGYGSILLRQGDEISRGRGSFGGFSSPLTMHCVA